MHVRVGFVAVGRDAEAEEVEGEEEEATGATDDVGNALELLDAAEGTAALAWPSAELEGGK